MGKIEIIEVEVKDKIAQTTTENAFIVCGNSDYKIKFTFDEEWDNENVKTALFVYGGNSIPVVFSGNICEAPVFNNTTLVKVGVVAGNIKTTTSAYIPCKRAITDEGGTIPEPPKEEVYNKIVEMVNDISLDIPKLGATLNLSIDENFVLTVSLNNMDGEMLSQKSIDLPIESLVKTAYYDDTEKSIVFVLESEEKIVVPVYDLVDGFVREEDFTELKQNVGKKQNSVDENLETQTKEIVGAINEVKSLAEQARMIFGEEEGTAYEGNKGKKNADDIQEIKLKMDLIERNIFQSGLGSIVPVTEAFTSRQTANGLNILDPSPAVVEMIKGKTVKSTNLIPFPYMVGTETRSGVDITVNADGSISVKGTATDKLYIVLGNYSQDIFPAGTYYISGHNSGVASLYIEYYQDTTHVKSHQNNRAFTLDWNGYNKIRIYFFIGDGKTVDGTVYPMLNEGDTAKPFVPYFSGLKHANFKAIKSTGKNGEVEEYTDGNTYELAEYDYIYPQTGELVTQTRTIVFDGTEEWGFTDANEYGLCDFRYGIYPLNAVYNVIVCPSYPTKDILHSNSKEENIYCSGGQIAIRSSQFSTLEDWKAHLAELYAKGTPLVVEYKLVTPTITPLTDYPKEYTAYNGGSETVEQGDTDNSQWGAITEITNEYWVIKEI